MVAHEVEEEEEGGALGEVKQAVAFLRWASEAAGGSTEASGGGTEEVEEVVGLERVLRLGMDEKEARLC